MVGNRPHSAFTRSTNVANDKGRSSGSPHIRQSSHPVGTVTIGSPMSIEVYSCGYSPGIERTALTGFPIRTFPRAAGRSPLSGTKVKFFRIKPNLPFRISESTDSPDEKRQLLQRSGGQTKEKRTADRPSPTNGPRGTASRRCFRRDLFSESRSIFPPDAFHDLVGIRCALIESCVALRTATFGPLQSIPTRQPQPPGGEKSGTSKDAVARTLVKTQFPAQAQPSPDNSVPCAATIYFRFRRKAGKAFRVTIPISVQERTTIHTSIHRHSRPHLSDTVEGIASAGLVSESASFRRDQAQPERHGGHEKTGILLYDRGNDPINSLYRSLRHVSRLRQLFSAMGRAPYRLRLGRRGKPRRQKARRQQQRRIPQYVQPRKQITKAESVP